MTTTTREKKLLLLLLLGVLLMAFASPVVWLSAKTRPAQWDVSLYWRDSVNRYRQIGESCLSPAGTL